MSASVLRPQLLIGLFLESPTLEQSLTQYLSDPDRYRITIAQSEAAFVQLIEHEKQQLDCLILQTGARFASTIKTLQTQATLLPAIILSDEPQPDFWYHTAEMVLPLHELGQLESTIDRAIEAFLDLSPACQLPNPDLPPDLTRELTTQNFLMLQQRRLSEKLKERLDYLGVYYNRNPKSYLRYLTVAEQDEFLQQLRNDYRIIVLNYFADDPGLNQKIDNFVNTVFFADVAVSQIVEIHMELMDEFSKQLKLEGRSEEVLLDYRLTLIDTLAHLCEMYRRSIPRES